MVHVQEKATSAAPKGDAPATMTGGQALVESLKRQGITTIFGLPGVQLDGAFNALYEAQQKGELRVLHTRHEQGTAYMADGYARTTGEIGTCLVVPGPGLLNASGALSTAYACNSPVLCVTGQIQSNMIGFGRGLLHEIPNQLEMIRSVTKHSARAMHPAEIPALVNDAVTALWQGRVRPVEIEVPPDVFFADGEVSLLPGVGPRPRPAGDPEKIEEAAKLLGQAKSPLIFVGGGVLNSGAWDELLSLAEMLQAPVVMSSNGKGAISDHHYLAQNSIGAMALMPEADVILAVGTRFVDPSTSIWALKGQHTVIQMDADDEEVGRNYPVTLGIVADAKAGLAALAAATDKHNIARSSRERELTAVKRDAQAKLDSVHPQADFANAIRRELPEDGIFVSEMTQIGYWSNVGFPVYQPRTYLTPGYQGTLGWGFPTSLGVKVAAGDRVVVSVNGDGGFGFACNELATQAQHNLASITIVFNDGAYGNVRRIQDQELGGRIIASELKNPNYQKLAEAFGVAGRKAETPDELGVELGEAIKANEPTLIEVPVGVMPNPWKSLGLR